MKKNQIKDLGGNVVGVSKEANAAKGLFMVSDMHVGEIVSVPDTGMNKVKVKAMKMYEGDTHEPLPLKIDASGLMVKLKEQKIFQPMYKWDGIGTFTKIKPEAYLGTNPCAEHFVAGGKALKHEVTQMVTLKVEPPKAYPMPLLNPKSKWGKRMAEKLAQKS